MKIATYNIMSGGFDGYMYNVRTPQRLKLFQKVLHEIDADFIGLTDTFRWKDIYSDEDLKKIFGYQSVFHININDERVDKNIGITVMTNLAVSGFETVRLYNRDCLKTTICKSAKLIEVYTVYLDDLSEETRLKQIDALLKVVSKSKPTIIIGDFNAMRSSEVDFLPQAFKKYSQKERQLNALKPIFKELAKAKVIKKIKKWGFKEDGTFLPTYPTKLNPYGVSSAVVQVDHIFISKDLKINSFEVIKNSSTQKASDHYPICANI